MSRLFILFLITIPGFSELTHSYQRNSLIDESYDDYMEGRYDEVIYNISIIEDSLQYFHDGLKLNRAHAYYKNGKFGSLEATMMDPSDSIFIQNVGKAMAYYAQVLESEGEIASIAYLQSGVMAFRTGIVNGRLQQPLDAIDTAIGYFKNALMKDPDNEAARYNYETLKRFREFPDQLIARAEELVRDRKFEEAYRLLAPYAEKDPRFSGKREYIQRLGQIVQIEKGLTGS